MKAKRETTAAPLAVIGVDIGKEVVHLVGFGTDGKIAFRKRIRRLGLKEAFEQPPPVLLGWKSVWARSLSAGRRARWAIENELETQQHAVTLLQERDNGCLYEHIDVWRVVEMPYGFNCVKYPAGDEGVVLLGYVIKHVERHRKPSRVEIDYVALAVLGYAF